MSLPYSSEKNLKKKKKIHLTFGSVLVHSLLSTVTGDDKMMESMSNAVAILLVTASHRVSGREQLRERSFSRRAPDVSPSLTLPPA